MKFQLEIDLTIEGLTAQDVADALAKTALDLAREGADFDISKEGRVMGPKGVYIGGWTVTEAGFAIVDPADPDGDEVGFWPLREDAEFALEQFPGSIIVPRES